MASDFYLFSVIIVTIISLIFASTRLKMHPFVALLLASFAVGTATETPLLQIVTTIQKGFGDLIGYIGLVVILGSILGVALEKSGAALRLAAAILNGVGKKRPALGMSFIGTLVGIPVFCDSGFIILSSLNNALAHKSGVTKATLTLALASGLYTTHTLIPPTPGPIAAAGNLGASQYIGLVMLMGLVVSVPVVLMAYFWALLRGKNIEIPVVLDVKNDEKMPALWKALLPIVLPVLLITLASVVQILNWGDFVSTAITFAGQPIIALLLGTGLTFLLFDAKDKGKWIGEGIQLSGPILIITGAGGAFGAVLKATALADSIKVFAENGFGTGIFLLILAFFIAALFKTMQGSSTSALVITSSILAPLLPALGFDAPIEIVLLVMAIGAGSMTVSHANDSYFWVVSQFSGMPLKEAYRSYTVMTGIQGLIAIFVTILCYLILT